MKDIFSVHDSCSTVWNDPFTAINRATAIRSFTDAVNGQDSDLKRHPEHFSLWVIGTFDPSTGYLNLIEPECILRAIDVTEQTN